MPKTDTITICYECRHFHNEEPSGPRKDVWYNHYCKSSPSDDLRIDPVTGMMAGDGFKYCRDVNKGACKKWEAIEV